MKSRISTLLVVTALLLPLVALAVDNVPAVDLNARPDGSGRGAFKLLICDGPAGLNHYNPTTGNKSDMTLKPNSQRLAPGESRYLYGPSPNYIPCDFTGLMKQAQFLINAMIVIGVFAAMIGFAIAGYNYILGTPSSREKAHAIFPKIFWGFIIMLTAWFIVKQILTWLTPTGSAYLL